MRVRTCIDVTKPLKFKMKLKKPGGEWFWVSLRYERLPSFCFHCGIIGHADTFCLEAFDNPLPSAEKPFGSWLRAGGRRGGTASVNKWLVLEEPSVDAAIGVQPRSPGSHNEELMQTGVGGNPLHGLSGNNDIQERACERGGALTDEEERERVVIID